MSSYQPLSHLIPEWTLPWIAVAAAVAFVLGRPRAGSGFALAFILLTWLTPILKPWLEQQPLWLQAVWVLAVWILLMQAIISLIFGRAVGDGFATHWVIRIVDLLVLGPLRGIAYLLRVLIR